MKIKKTIFILVFIWLPSLAFASFTVNLENSFDRKMFYFLYWIDHPYGWRAPANMAGGELEALEKTQLIESFQEGKYRVVWKDREQWKNEMLIHIKKEVTSITIRPEKVEF